jgi:hypothetical protein
LHQDLLIDQLAQNGPGERGLAGGVWRELQPLRSTLIDSSEDITPEKRLVPDDGDDAID